MIPGPVRVKPNLSVTLSGQACSVSYPWRRKSSPKAINFHSFDDAICAAKANRAALSTTLNGTPDFRAASRH